MSREIKFRMVYQTTGEIIGYTDAYRLLRYGEDELPDYEKAILYGVSFEQSTGLKDKNGKEIYEGDIVKVANLATVFKVEYRRSGAQFRLRNKKRFEDFWFWKKEAFEVIGNIHENPELIA